MTEGVSGRDRGPRCVSTGTLSPDVKERSNIPCGRMDLHWRIPRARPQCESQLSRKIWARWQACPGGAVRAGAAVRPAEAAQILKAISGSATHSQASDIWEVLP